MASHLIESFRLVLQRSWLALSGFITVLLIPISLSEIEQGIFFYFLSVAALQSIFEAGVTTAFMNFTAHERATLENPSSNISDIEVALRKIKYIRSFTKKWFNLVSTVFIVCAGLGGYFYLLHVQTKQNISIDWILPYAVLIFSIGLGLNNLSKISVLEGLGKIGDIAIIRLYAGIASSLTLWLTLWNAFGLWSLSLSYAVQVTLVAILTSRLEHEHLTRIYDATPPLSRSEEMAELRKQILPTQIRLGISYLCGYITSQAFVPFALANYGTSEAGKIGLTLSIFGAVAAILSSYIYITGPKYSSFIIRKEWRSLGVKFRSVTLISLLIAAVSYISLIVVFVAFRHKASIYASRLIDLDVMILVAVIGLSNIYIGSTATKLRAFRQEPLMLFSIISALAYFLVMAGTINRSIYDAFVLLAIYHVAIAVPIVLWIDKNFMKEVTATNEKNTS